MSCPACGGVETVPFFDGGRRPLATVARFPSADAARSAARLPHDWVRCTRCGHVFNASFDEASVPAEDAHPGWGMWNGAALWIDFMRETAARLAAPLSRDAVVVELGHGGGEFIGMIADARSDITCLGFDPYGVEREGRPRLRRALATPESLRALNADLVVVRHVLEHLAAPLDFLKRIGGDQRVYVEVPCIDRAIASSRTVDFFYEHAQQFTTTSFHAMIGLAGSIEEEGHGYDGEVVWAIARLGKPSIAAPSPNADFAREAADFHARARASRETIREQLADLVSSEKRIAIWGGAGKAAAFIAHYDLDAVRFPLVVDSDPSKVGTFVAGTGQPIRDPSELRDTPADVILIPSQWRARDITHEMWLKRIGGLVLIEHDGRLVEWSG